MPKDGNAKRDGRATRIPAEPEAEQVAARLADPSTTRGQRNFIDHTLRELSRETGVSLPKSPADLRDFYVTAGYSLGAAGARWRMREILRLIGEGERFDDYRNGDPFYVWKDKRARRKHSCTTRLAAELEKRLADPKTPADYRAALKGALRDYCVIAGSQYKAKSPAWSYIEAEAESEAFCITSREWHKVRDARTRVVELLDGLRKRRPLEAASKRCPARRAQETDDAAPQLDRLRSTLRHLLDEGEAHNESAIFRINREIHDLENADTTPADEWPDTIPG